MRRSNGNYSKPKKRLKYIGDRITGKRSIEEGYTPKTRDDYQKEALNHWARQGFKGSVIAATGFGKSRVAALAIGYSMDELVESGDTDSRCLVLVPTTQLQDQFPHELKKWGFENYLDRIDFMCYASAHKLEGKHYHVVVCDEIHLGLSPVYRKFFEKNTFDRLLCLTATIPEDPEYRKVLANLAPPCFHITLDECVDAGFVADYEIYCVGVDLEEAERAEYDRYHKQFVRMSAILGKFGQFQHAQNILSGKIQGPKGVAAQYMNAIRGRRQTVQEAVSKIKGAADVCKFYEGEKILTFGGTNKFTDRVADFVGAPVYHSGKTKKQRRDTLEEFKSGKSKVLCSTKALNQGMDVPDVGIGIIVGLESKSLPMIQRLGRIIRKDGEKIGKIYIFYVLVSQEEKWLEEATKTLKNVKQSNNLKDFLS